jgi:hypothetical protein
MNTNKIIPGGIAGGIAYFLLGWVIYGMLLMDYMAANTNQSVMRAMDDYQWWALMLGNLFSGLLLATIFSWSNIRGMAAGAKAGAVIGLLLSLSMDLMFYSMSTMYSDISVIVVDVIVSTVMTAIAGGVVGVVMDMGKTPAIA